MLHGKRTERGRKRDTLTIKFLKKYIHYAKHRIQPELTDEVLIVSRINWSFLSIVNLLYPIHAEVCQMYLFPCSVYWWPLDLFPPCTLDLLDFPCALSNAVHLQASDNIATAYAELRNASSNAKVSIEYCYSSKHIRC